MNRSAAVGAKRAPDLVEADSAEQKIWRGLDYFPTPPWAARAGAEIVKHLDPCATAIWEPACGEGHMALPLEEYFHDVRMSDIHDHGIGARVADFRDDDVTLTGDFLCDWVITNPPFKHAEEFVRRGMLCARRGVAVLCRLQFLEGGARYRLLHKSLHPLSHCAVFAERVSMTLGCWDPSAGLPTAYAWFIFDKHYAHQVRCAEIIGIPPGTRARLTKPTDIANFARRSHAPLLDEIPAQSSAANAKE
jgi:hypothetical protein